MHDLENSTTRLGELLRTFQSNVCPAYQTFDLPSEEAARVRRKAAAAKKRAVTINKGKDTGSGSRKPRTFNLNTYKTHALGAYAKAIQLYGTPDGYNSQTVCNSAKITLLSYAYCRVNLSTNEGSASLRVYEMENMPFLVLVFKSVGNV